MRRLIIILSFFLVHVVIAILVFLFGAVIGAGELRIMSATGGNGPTERGIDGGFNAIGHLAILYIFTIGIVPLAISLISTAIAFVATRHLAPSKKEKERQELERFQDYETPRLSIAYLLLWTTCCAIGCGLSRIQLSSIQLSQDDSYQIFLSLFMVLSGITLGTAGAALLLWGYWRYQQIPFPRYDGEVLLSALAISTVLRSFALIVLSTVLTTFSGWLIVFVTLPFALILFGAIPFVRDTRWTVLLSLFGLFVLTGGFLLLAPVVLGALLVTTIIDVRQTRSYPWTHWSGLGLGLLSVVSQTAFQVYALFFFA